MFLRFLFIVCAIFVLMMTTSVAVYGIDRLLLTTLTHHGDMMYAALYGLPETRPLFLSVVSDRDFSTYAPSYLGQILSATEKEDLLQTMPQQIQEQAPSVVSSFKTRWDSWLRAHQQLEVFGGFYAIEKIMEVAYMLPQTSPAFDQALHQRGLTHDQVTPQTLAEMLASAEIAGWMYEWLALVSGLDHHAQLQYYRSFYDQLLQQESISAE